MRTELDWARTIVCGREATVIELGAHHGNDTLQIHAACSHHGSFYLAVEADPRNISVLVRRTQGLRNMSVVHAAIAGYSGEIDFHLSDGGGNGSGSIREPKEHLQHFPQIRFDSVVRVPCVTLDDLARQYRIKRVDLIWCDLQGAERDMIAGGAETLARTDYLLAEADRCEMYAGQAQRDELIALLPQFELIAEWPEGANLLFRKRQ